MATPEPRAPGAATPSPHEQPPTSGSPTSGGPSSGNEARIRRIERELLVRARLTHLVGSGLAPLVTSVGQEIVVPAGSVLYRRGAPPRHLYTFVRGDIELTAPDRVPRLLRDQSGVGLLDVLADQPRTFTATALTTLHTTRVAADDYLDFLEEHFELVMAALLGVADDIHQQGLALAPDGGFPPLAERLVAKGHWPPPPTDLVRRIDVLRTSRVFHAANVQALVRLARLAREVRVDEGATLFVLGEAAGQFFLVADGVVEARHEAPDIVAWFGPGDLVCGYGALGPADDAYVATARSPVVAFAFSEEDFFDVMEEHFDLMRSVLAGLASEFQRLILERERRAIAPAAHHGTL